MFFYQKRFEKKSFSQCGEDSIVEHIFMLRKIDKPSYIDIGAYHPFALSNTAKFYLKGGKGITIEPNPDQHKHFKLHRGRDINLNIGIGDTQGELLYYKMNNPTMNTFDGDAAKDLVANHGFKIIQEIKLPIRDLRSVIKEHAENIFPDFLSLDVEGLDEQILTQIDYDNNRPKVICVETTEYTNDGTGQKNKKLINFLEDKEYMIYADTHINSIFVNKEFWFKSR
jgi:FkbM family methyltransferase